MTGYYSSICWCGLCYRHYKGVPLCILCWWCATVQDSCCIWLPRRRANWFCTSSLFF